ncbi:MAG: hypothetical protein JNJ65_12250 [Cyclobacteriaceae bacterium]|nr:hypothetical protein [Cyclobacteriaceae bacterium]
MKLLFVLPLFLLQCASAWNAEAEKALVRQQLLEQLYQSLQAGNADLTIAPVPEMGDLTVTGGDILRSTRAEVQQHYQDQLEQMIIKEVALQQDPVIEFLSKEACYGAAKVKWTYVLKADSTRQEQEFISSTLFVGQKINKRWYSVASAQTNAI